MLIGNKIDKQMNREITTHQGQQVYRRSLVMLPYTAFQLAKDYGMEFFETSALSSENISEVNYMKVHRVVVIYYSIGIYYLNRKYSRTCKSDYIHVHIL